jgi:hypothetical protein
MNDEKASQPAELNSYHGDIDLPAFTLGAGEVTVI